MTEIYLHIFARMADYMATHPYVVGSEMVSEKPPTTGIIVNIVRRVQGELGCDARSGDTQYSRLQFTA